MGLIIFIALSATYAAMGATDSVLLAGFGAGIENLWQSFSSLSAEHVQEIATRHMGLTLAICFASGILTSLTPCVYPMIPITINIFGRMSREDKDKSAFNVHSFLMAGVYVGGMCLTYSVMGLVAGMTGSLFGKVLQSSFTLAFLTLLFFVLSLGQFGVFKMSMPSAIQSRVSTLGHGNSAFGIFLMGLFSGLIISPCVGPVIAGILAFVVNSSNPWMGLLYFFSFSLGLGVLFLLIGGFSGVLSRLPRSGGWMIRVNRLLACLMLLASAYYGVLLLKKVGVLNRTIPTEAAQNGGGIPWTGDEAAALKLARERNAFVVIDFTAEWCEACHELEKDVFQNPAVIARMKSFVPLRLDFTEETPAVKDLTIKYGVISLPTISFIAPDGKALEKPRVNGVLTPEKFISVLDSLEVGNPR